MKFAVKAWSNGRARTGLLHLGNYPNPIETPALLLPTRKGLPYFISPDLLPSLPSPDSHLLQVCPLHFLEGLSPKTISKIGGLHQMVGLPEYGFAAVARDSVQCLPECNSTNKVGASFETPCGRLLIKPADYVEMISSMKPNIWATLADEVPAWVSDKRNKTSVDRTVRWLDECIALSSAGGAVFGSIVGGPSVEERERCAQEVARRNVSGYWIGGLGLGESMDERPALLNAVTHPTVGCGYGENIVISEESKEHRALQRKAILQEEKPRLVCGLGLPEEVLQGVAAGIDLFDSEYIYHLTLGGFALTFPLGGVGINVSSFDPNNLGSDRSKINLRATIYRAYPTWVLTRKDTSPVVENCSCYTCQNHTKAYINHLLNVHEMLAQILLEIHNTHHYLKFFSSIREAIKAGEFEQFRKRFIESRRDHLAVAAVCV
ncbi:hypothetical protein FEM48_Zijuj06G0165700 [Ziziphus jujuba var. spinosa]|uniref:Queuine tRNA-ribosyltransferase accessory subunit 2 n=1 Tax=Ziziphus jujuba var. spinosa TaxID=714518 RepID=A0A978VAE1_ZIZJJ|nr:hypothetical protein FEM48_Zijuj06G0165700 [Ziziphus jujuba var. spinosa]